MKTFTVTIDGVERKIKGPDKATQKQAQAEAERQIDETERQRRSHHAKPHKKR